MTRRLMGIGLILTGCGLRHVPAPNPDSTRYWFAYEIHVPGENPIANYESNLTREDLDKRIAVLRFQRRRGIPVWYKFGPQAETLQRKD